MLRQPTTRTAYAPISSSVRRAKAAHIIEKAPESFIAASPRIEERKLEAGGVS